MPGFLATEAKIDGPTFRRFALFDAFGRQRRWRQPLFFCALMSAFAAVCWFSGREGGHLLGAVLLGVGVVVPFVYVAMFLLSVRRRAKGVKGDAVAYRLRLTPFGLLAQRGRESLSVAWKDMRAVYGRPGCAYLYVNEAKAFLWPNDGQDVLAFARRHRSDICK